MMAGNLPVVPSRASLSASGRAAAPSTVRNGSEHFFGAVHNNVSRPQSFQAQTASLRQSMAQNHVGAIPAGGREGAGESAARGASGGQRTSASSSRTFTPSSAEARGAVSAANRDGFRPFTPPSHRRWGEAGAPSSGSAERGSSGSYWNRTAPSSGESRGSYSDGYGRGSTSRPQLDMRQPIVRSPYGGSRGAYGGGYHAPTYHAPSSGGSHTAPSGGGGHVSAPSGGGHASGGGGGHSGGGGHR